MACFAIPNLDELSSIKCLLIGAGTVGCQVARMLMAWGVQKITLLDNGKVAMSNALRQSLYTLDDFLNGGDFKALAAAKSLKRIFPAVDAEGIVMSIPMPGHPMTSQEEKSVFDDCNHLHNLSTANRTLDQQCSVTRPGLAPNASSLAAELFVNVLHHPDGMFADSVIANSTSSSELPHGILPHHIWGSLFHFSQMTHVGHSSNSCTACCSTVVSEYQNRGI